MISAYSLQHTEYAYCINVSSELWCVKAYLYVALSSQVINLGWLYLTHKLNERHRVGEVSIVEVEIGLTFEVRDALAEVNG